MEESNSSLQYWASVLGGALTGASEGLSRAQGTAGVNAPAVGTAGVVPYQDQSAQQAQVSNTGGMDVKTIAIYAAIALAAVVVLKKI